jgi:hypothetical protein
MQATTQTTVRQMVEQIGTLLRRQAELYAEQQRLLDELSTLRAEKDDLLVVTQRAQLVAND